MEIYYSPDFIKQFKKLPKNIQSLAIIKEKIFRLNPFNASLKTHKLAGHLQGYWSFSVNYQIRIVFSFKKDIAYFIIIGDHSIYRKK